VVHGPAALDLRLPDDLPAVLADRVLVEQVIFNLLDNALRHTPDGTPVRVESSVGDDDRARPVVRLTVSDDGPGLPHDLVRDLQRRRRASTRAGVGLAICEEVARVHGDRLHIDDRAEGTRLTLTLPRA
jgi:two-component system sensor histidine kinase KdpD